MDKNELWHRPLTEEEKIFAEENYNLFWWFMKKWALDEDEIDALTIPYLYAVKEYLSRSELQQYAFSTIVRNRLKGSLNMYYRAMNSKRRMPDGGIYSIDYCYENRDGKKVTLEKYLKDENVDIERQVTNQETHREFEHIVNNFTTNRAMRIVLDLLLNAYTNKEIFEYMSRNFPELEFDIKKINYTVKQLRFAFREAGLDSYFQKESICGTLYFDILEYAIKEKIIKRKGARLLYNGEVIGKGRDEGRLYLQTHRSETNEIIHKLKSKYMMCKAYKEAEMEQAKVG